MGNAEIEERYKKDFRYCSRQSLKAWAEDFLQDLRAARKKEDMM
jgi:hypothetical protein